MSESIVARYMSHGRHAVHLRRWRVTVAERRAMVDMLHQLTDAARHLPIKRRDRTPEQQAAVELWTQAVIDSRALLNELADAHYDRELSRGGG